MDLLTERLALYSPDTLLYLASRTDDINFVRCVVQELYLRLETSHG